MTVYFKEVDWNNLKDKLHKVQGLITDENSDISSLVGDCLDILEQQEIDEATDEIIYENNIRTNKKNSSKNKTIDGAYIV
ncbi:MAG: hypothetical protein AB4372_21430 [Xenococcus sp. (in: cyanobacteria)]